MVLFTPADRIEKAEEATHVLVASNIKGHAISTVVADNPLQAQELACRGQFCPEIGFEENQPYIF